MTLSRDVLTGLFFVVVGLTFAGMAFSGLQMGTAARMGPGYYPVLLSILLVALGLAIMFGMSGESEEPGAMISLRSLLLLGGAPVIFGLTINSLGFLPATFLTVFATCLADRSIGLLRALITSAAITAFCIAVFIYGVEVRYPLIAF